MASAEALTNKREKAVSQAPVSAQVPDSLLRRWRWPLMLGGPLLILAVVAYFVVTSGGSQSTDDAYVQAARVPISASIGGRVTEVDVAENQPVKAGQVLFRLDVRDYQASQEEAAAQLAAAQLQVKALQAAYIQQQASLKTALDSAAFNIREATRQKSLLAAGVSSRDQYEAAQHNADMAAEQVDVARQQLAQALANLGGTNITPDNHPMVLRAKAALDKAKLNVSYGVVVAPQDGIATRVSELQAGSYVNAAQTLFWLVSGVPWVEANFKENQLAKMKVGQPAKIRVDAYPGDPLPGHVQSFSPGSGQVFSPLPAQNATGNWVKVVQRLPVRIAFDKPPPDMAGRAGLSATVVVNVKPGSEQAGGGR